MFKRVILPIFLIFFLTSNVFAFWVWSPKTKKFENPKWTARQTPKEQFEFAKSLYDLSEFKKAYVEFRKVIKFFPKAYEAAESQFYIGACFEKFSKPYHAYLAYQKVIDKYPFSDKMEDVLEREFAIAEQLTEEDSKFLGLTFPQEHLAIEIYQKIISNAPYSKWAPLSQYKIGVVLKAVERFGEAKKEFQKVIAEYPESEWAESAKFQIAFSASKASLASDYDQELTKEAKERFERFIQTHPDIDLSEDAQEIIGELENKEAEKDFNIAQFYEKQREFNSATMYYESILARYPKSKWAQMALERMQLLEEEGKI